ncbi:hypothetical protein KO518_11370 [Aestuariibacter sp. A3R04]|nr:hypothetical protein [Aestuariibacter sp. A3R04]
MGVVVLLFLVFSLCALLFYVEAMRCGMNAKKWALAGLVFGPVLFPMFNMKRYLLWRQCVGYGGPLFSA